VDNPSINEMQPSTWSYALS